MSEPIDYRAECVITVTNFLNQVLKNVGKRLAVNRTKRPFQEALHLPFDSIFWPAFERSFSTSLGTTLEELARLAALKNGATSAVCQTETYVSIDKALSAAIDAYLLAQRSNNPNIKKDWKSTLATIKSTKLSEETSEFRIISDLSWTKDGITNYLSMKTVQPNLDQTEHAKRDCLYLALAEPDCNVYFGLPYNPYGDTREDYKWSVANRIFDMQNDPVVLIGRDMWNEIGGSDCYNQIISIFHEAGQGFNSKIKALQKTYAAKS